MTNNTNPNPFIIERILKLLKSGKRLTLNEMSGRLRIPYSTIYSNIEVLVKKRILRKMRIKGCREKRYSIIKIKKKVIQP